MEQEFQNRQSAIRQGVALLNPPEDGPKLGGAQLFGATYSTLKALLPTEAVMQGDVDAMIQAGGVQAKMGRFINEWSGKDLRGDTERFRKDATQLLREINQENNRKFRPVYDNAVERWQDMRRRGIDARLNAVFNYGEPEFYEVPTVTGQTPGIVPGRGQPGEVFKTKDGQELIMGRAPKPGPNRRRRDR
jgi:hypothetical protein